MAAQLDLFGNPIPEATPKAAKKNTAALAKKPLQIYSHNSPTTEETSNLNNLEHELAATANIEVAEPQLTQFEQPDEQTETIVVAAIETEELDAPNVNIAFNQLQEIIEPTIAVDDRVIEFSVEDLATTPLPTIVEKTLLTKTENRGRKSYKEIEATADLIQIPATEILEKKLYYGIGEVASWFQVNTSQIRFWENEFDILKPRKTKKGDRLFRVEDIKNLELIHHLLRVKKLSIQGAKDYLKAHKKNANLQFALTQSLEKFRGFLLELKANL